MATEPDNPASVADEISKHLISLRSANTDSIRTLRREYSKRLAKSPGCFVVQVARQLLSKKTETHRFVAYELVNQHGSALAGLGEKELKQMGEGINSWSSVDMFGCFISGPA